MNPKRDVSFMIVGMPRSGTTLVQRLACEIPGIRIPPETQFFWTFAPKVLSQCRFPLDEPALRQQIHAFVGREKFRDVGISTEGIVEDLGGKCDSVVDLFGAIVRNMAGPAEVYGEKTPRHLLWCRALGRRLPNLRFVGVVRDPRGVIASYMKLHWRSKSHVLLAQRWSLDQRYLLKTQQTLGRDRVLLLRYEDAVSDPHAVRTTIARFLNVPFDGQTTAVTLEDIAVPRETWKANATGAISAERARAWKTSLTSLQIDEITAICRREMEAFDYRDGLPPRIAAYQRLARMDLRQQARRLRLTGARAMNVLNIERLARRIEGESVSQTSAYRGDLNVSHPQEGR